jgi:hypothetical protein
MDYVALRSAAKCCVAGRSGALRREARRGAAERCVAPSRGAVRRVATRSEGEVSCGAVVSLCVSQRGWLALFHSPLAPVGTKTP